jgi:hypothetical protein
MRAAKEDAIATMLSSCRDGEERIDLMDQR